VGAVPPSAGPRAAHLETAGTLLANIHVDVDTYLQLLRERAAEFAGLRRRWAEPGVGVAWL
jgi:hypothetical protein